MQFAISTVTSAIDGARQGARAAHRFAATFPKNFGRGILKLSYNSSALLGLCVVATALFICFRPDLRHAAESHLFGWLQARHQAPPDSPVLLAATWSDPQGIHRATAANPKELSREQAAVVHWISRRFSVAPEPLSRLVRESWHIGQRAALDPTLILAVMAVESSFNPFAQSSVGAQGLMQVMTRIHVKKYDAYGGNYAAFDPVSNLRVGVQILKECIQKAGSVQGGLRYYVGAANLPSDAGYAAKVLAMQAQLRMVASGRSVSTQAAVGKSLKATPPGQTLASVPPKGTAEQTTAPTNAAPTSENQDQIASLWNSLD